MGTMLAARMRGYLIVKIDISKIVLVKWLFEGRSRQYCNEITL